MIRTLRCTAFVAVALVLSSGTSRALPITFNVVDALSSLSIDPAGGPRPSSAQGPGSLTAAYSGIVVADVTATTIQLLPTTRLVAGNSGNWGPGISYPLPAQTNRAENDIPYITSTAFANYGLTYNLQNPQSPNAPTNAPTAIRNLQISLADAAPKPLIGGVFSEAGSTPNFVSGIQYYSYGSTQPTGPITNYTGLGLTYTSTFDVLGDGTLTQVGNLLTLTLPVRFTESHFLTNFTYYGTIVAVANAPVPEPATIALIAAAAPMVLVARRVAKRK